MSGKEIFVSRGGMLVAPAEGLSKFEAFLSGAERFKNQGILVSTFEENTIVKSWKLRDGVVNGTYLCGRVPGIEGSPIMKLGCVNLSVFKNKRCLEQSREDLYFYNEAGRIYLKFGQDVDFNLKSEYYRWLIDLTVKVASKVNSVLK